MEKIHSSIRAKILAEALPYMQMYDSKYVVVKYGGHAMVNDNLADIFAQNIVMLQQAGMKPVVVHGGGPQIGETLKAQGVESKFHNGLRITDRDTIKVVERVLYEIINTDIVKKIKKHGSKSISLSGNKDSIILLNKSDVQDKENHKFDADTILASVKNNKNIDKLINLIKVFIVVCFCLLGI